MKTRRFSVLDGTLALLLVAAGFLVSLSPDGPAWLGRAGTVTVVIGTSLGLFSFKRAETKAGS